MAYPNAIEVCRAELFTKEVELRERYPGQMVEKRKDSKTMERAATAYGKLNRVDLEDEQAIPLDQIIVQPFMATDDPRVLGIEPIPNIADKILAMIEKYRKETIDIEDVEFEEYDGSVEI